MSTVLPAVSESVRRITDALDVAARAYGDQPAMRVKRDGLWHATTWREYRSLVHQAARAFIHLGAEAGSGVAILGNGCPAWFISDLAAIACGAVPAGIYTTSSAEQCRFITDHCDAAVAVVDDPRQLAKYRAVWPQLPKLKHIVLMHGADDDPRVHSWEEFLRLGLQIPESALQERLQAQRPDDVCTLIYTSGTTGQPKGVMLSHDNLVFTAHQVLASVELRHGDQCLSYLPLSHIAEQVVSLHGPIFFGGCTWFAESLDKLGDNLREVRPHYFLGVPRVWEKIQAKIQSAAAGNSALKKKIAGWARQEGLRGGYALQNGNDPGRGYWLAEKLVFTKVRQALGLDRCRVQITSAAPIGRSTLEYFLSLGIVIHEVYGMSECTGPATISVPTCWATGKAGPTMTGTELKIADDGEVCMRGRHVFKGYWKSPEATAETIDAEGWLHSGDVGSLDSRGMLQITDRKKDLLITAGGENIAPQYLEGLLKGIPLVAQAVVVGDQRKYLGALLTLDPEKIASEAALIGSPARDVHAAATCERFGAHLQKAIDALNSQLAQVQTIKRWVVIPSEFTIEGGELTPTMKIKRKVIRDKYSAEIESLYA
jgi:long-subunit acyl-CoA synthetase (AMP-forming)